MISLSKKNLVKLFFAMGVGFLISTKCKMSGSGTNVRFRPPSYLFGIVWPILYLLIGVSWITSSDTQLFTYKKIPININDILFVSLSLLLGLWIYVYSCMDHKLGSLYVMFIIFLNLLCLMILISKTSQLLLAPLCVWLLYATFILTTDIQLSK